MQPVCCLHKTHFKYKETYRSKVNEQRKIYHANINQKKAGVGTSLVVQGVRLCAPNAGGPGSITGWGTRSPMHAATKEFTCHN